MRTHLQGQFPERCNMGMVALEKVENPEEMELLRGFISEHQRHTGSTVAQAVLDDFGTAVTKFAKVKRIGGKGSCIFTVLMPSLNYSPGKYTDIWGQLKPPWRGPF